MRRPLRAGLIQIGLLLLSLQTGTRAWAAVRGPILDLLVGPSATPEVLPYQAGRLQWAWVSGADPTATGFVLDCATTPLHRITKVYALEDRQAPVDILLPLTEDTWSCTIAALYGMQPGPPSPIYRFCLGRGSLPARCP